MKYGLQIKKLNSIESKISEALINTEISHEDFNTIINEEKKYRELKESIRMMNSQKSYTWKINLIKEGKKIDIGEVIKHNEIINKSLKFKTMPSYCLKCRKNTESINPRVSKTNNGKTMILLKCAIYGSKKLRFIKKQEASATLSNLGLKIPLNKIPLLRDILFWNYKNE